jgi:hypothetical protein
LLLMPLYVVATHLLLKPLCSSNSFVVDASICSSNAFVVDASVCSCSASLFMPTYEVVESVNRRRTGNTMAKRKRTKGQTTI